MPESQKKRGRLGRLGLLSKLKVKAAAATCLPPTRMKGCPRQLKYQQHQIDALVGQVKDLVAVVKATHTSSEYGRMELHTPTMGKETQHKGNTSQT